MKIIQTLTNEKVDVEEKLTAVTELVTKVRGIYGNTDADVPAKKVNTAFGMVDLGLLSPDEKVAVATGELRNIALAATEETDQTTGAVFDRAFEKLVATNRILCNIGAESSSAY